MDKNVIVLGLGRFGYTLASRLADKGVYVTAVDKDMDIVEKIADHVSNALAADITEEVALKSLGINNYDVAVIATGSNLEASIEATLICKDSGVEKVIAKASSLSHARILKKIGADQIVYPELDTAKALTRELTESNVLESIDLAEDFSVIEVKAHKSWFKKSLEELNFRQRYQMNVVAFKRGDELMVEVDPNVIIRENDILILVGTAANASKLDD